MKKRILLLTALAILLCGCGAGTPANQISLTAVGDESSENTLPFDDYYPDIKPDTPALTYLGRRDLKSSDTLKLYKKTFAADYSENDLLTREYCSENRLADALSEKISSDRSPDLTDKLPYSFPYLMSKNYYEDLTQYMDRSAPQWADFSPYIEYYSYNGNHFFYPETVTAAPYFLVYCKDRFSIIGIEDPETLFFEDKWTRTTFVDSAKQFRSVMGGVGIYGRFITDGFIAASGESVFSKTESGQFVCGLNSPKITEVFSFLTNELQQINPAGTFSGYDKLINGQAAFLLIDDKGYEELLELDSGKTYGVVPIPANDNSGVYYTTASCEGFLVPKGAKNVKGAACFINCGRITAEQNESDEGVLGKMRANNLTAVPAENYCFDSKTNSAVEAYLGSPFTQEDASQYLLDIENAVHEINALNE